ncbi:hypothetical protein EYB39_17370 [Pantoea agglomerans]|nr:hypothetical protein EYB39_17370 [Pantoea agglomerans]
MLTAELTGRNSGFSLAEDTDDLFAGKTLLHGHVLMWLMKTLLTSRRINQREPRIKYAGMNDMKRSNALIISLSIMLTSSRPTIATTEFNCPEQSGCGILQCWPAGHTGDGTTERARAGA